MNLKLFMCLNTRFEYGDVGIKYICFEMEFKFRDEQSGHVVVRVHFQKGIIVCVRSW